MPGEDPVKHRSPPARTIVLLQPIIILLAASSFTADIPRGGRRGSDSTAPRDVAADTVSSGTYTCASCRMPHKWRIDDRHLMYWDGGPYVPVAAFWSERERVPEEITDFNIWIDTDFRERGLSEEEFFADLDRATRQISARNGTYILLVAYPPKPKQRAQWIFDDEEVSRIASKWRQFAPSVRKEGLRALALYNEINSEDLWGWRHERFTPDDYGRALGDLSAKAKEIFGDVPIFFKTLGAYDGYRNVLAGAMYANGLGFDLFPRSCREGRFESESQYQVDTVERSLRSTRGSVGLLWVTEVGKFGGTLGSPTARYEPFSSRSELRCYFDALLDAGFTGFIYAPNLSEGVRRQYEWYAELKPYVQSRVLQRSRATVP